MKKIILDVDTGVDDAIGIILAAASPELDILGITTVSGNTDLESATRNTLRVLKLIGKDGAIPVHAGASKPLYKEPRYATEVHGATGMAGQLEDVEVFYVHKKHAVDFMIEQISAHKNEVTVVMTGPETNFALAIEKEPRVSEWVQEVIVMGGVADERGNESPVAEYNIAIDPHAAEKVFQSGAKVTMVGLDVTRKAVLTREHIEKITDNHSIREFVSGVTHDYMAMYWEKMGVYGCCMHDPLAVAFTIDPTLLKTIHRFVGVESDSIYCDGMTICDFDNRWGRKPNVHVAMEVDSERFDDLLVERLNRI